MANRQYRLATAGADKNVRVGARMPLSLSSYAQAYFDELSDLDGVPKRNHPRRTKHPTNHAASATYRLPIDLETTYSSRKRRPVESERSDIGFGRRW
jgi:hypothetical protein